MKRREWLSIFILAMVTVAALLIGIGQMYVTGPAGDRLFQPESLSLFFEIAVLFAAFILVSRKTQTLRSRMLLLAVIAAVFTWLHQVFLPVLVSGFYILFILKAGSLLRAVLDRDHNFVAYHEVTAMADFVLGSSVMILLYCLMSLFGIGSIIHTRIAVVVLAAVFALPVFVKFTVRFFIHDRAKPASPKDVKFGAPSDMRPRIARRLKERRGAMSWTAAVLVSLVLTMILLQAGRMNICVDYDSLHYGLRTEYILNNRNGIYQNLGSINVVYTYSKGLEILLLPLSGLPSYSFILSFQLWMTMGILAAAGKIAGLFVSRSYSVLCMALLSCIPGIMNMGITAKTDSVTVLYQLIMIYFLLLHLKKRRNCHLMLVFAAFIMTMVMKPTALVFSTIVLLTALGYMLVTKQLRFDRKCRFWFSLIPPVLMWALVWLRTFLLTGIPVTSVFYQVWEKLGFYARYPFLFRDIPSNGGQVFSRNGLVHFAKRLYGVLLAPVGEDMDHVQIAWGTPFLLIFLVLFLVSFMLEMKKMRKREKQPLICLSAIFLTISGASLAALYLLWQVDGNYFMLLYCLFAILAVIVAGNIKRTFLAHSMVEMMVPVAIFSISVTAVSNWSGVLGLSPVKVIHAGFYDHMAENKEAIESKGNRRIWGILSKDPETRALIFGEQPEMLLFPCNTQSYTDIEGSDGNLYISASPEALVCYLAYAKIQYVYVERGYITPGTDGWENVVTMIKKGYLTDIIYEEGNLLGRFVTEPVPPGNTGELLGGFAEKYLPGEQQ